MLSESARMSSAAEARFRVQAPNSQPRQVKIVALDTSSEDTVRRLAIASWNQASFHTAGYTIAAGVQNAFDVFPDRNTTVNSFNGIQTFPSQSPFGFNGRALYTRLAWKF